MPPDGWRVGEFEVRAALVAHRGPTLGYRIEQSGTSVCYLPDHEPALGTNVSSMPADWISGLGLARGATALIHDSQYADEEYRARRGWGHSGLADAPAFARCSEPERLQLFHHDSGHDDARLEALAVGASERAATLRLDSSIQLAREGQLVEL